jgi:hypothetical protein
MLLIESVDARDAASLLPSRPVLAEALPAARWCDFLFKIWNQVGLLLAGINKIGLKKDWEPFSS